MRSQRIGALSFLVRFLLFHSVRKDATRGGPEKRGRGADGGGAGGSGRTCYEGRGSRTKPHYQVTGNISCWINQSNNHKVVGRRHKTTT